jgi:hypothetical protein
MVFATVAFTIGISLMFGITTGYLVILTILRLFGHRSQPQPQDQPVLATAQLQVTSSEALR